MHSFRNQCNKKIAHVHVVGNVANVKQLLFCRLWYSGTQDLGDTEIIKPNECLSYLGQLCFRQTATIELRDEVGVNSEFLPNQSIHKALEYLQLNPIRIWMVMSQPLVRDKECEHGGNPFSQNTLSFQNLMWFENPFHFKDINNWHNPHGSISMLLALPARHAKPWATRARRHGSGVSEMVCSARQFLIYNYGTLDDNGNPLNEKMRLSIPGTWYFLVFVSRCGVSKRAFTCNMSWACSPRRIPGYLLRS